MEFVSVKKNLSLQHKLCITCEVSRGFVPGCSFAKSKVVCLKVFTATYLNWVFTVAFQHIDEIPIQLW